MLDSDIGVIETQMGEGMDWEPIWYIGPDRDKDGDPVYVGFRYIPVDVRVRFRYNPRYLEQLEQPNKSK